MSLILKILILSICVFIYIKYFEYLNRREDKYLKTKHMIARIILVFFSFYILYTIFGKQLARCIVVWVWVGISYFNSNDSILIYEMVYKSISISK